MSDVSQPTCRICFETEIDENDPLLNPCKCDGTSKYVHKNCLNTWRFSTSEDFIDFSEKKIKCMECKHHYEIGEIIQNQRCSNPLSQLIVKKNLHTAPFFVFILCFFAGNFICSPDKSKKYLTLLFDNNIVCINIIPFSITIIYLLIICYYHIILKTQTKFSFCCIIFNLGGILGINSTLIFCLGPIGITLSVAFMNIYIDQVFKHSLILELQPVETILNYTPPNSIINNLNYSPPSPSCSSSSESESPTRYSEIDSDTDSNDHSPVIIIESSNENQLYQ